MRRPAPAPEAPCETKDGAGSPEVFLLLKMIDATYETLQRHVQSKHENRSDCSVCAGVMRDYLKKTPGSREPERGGAPQRRIRVDRRGGEGPHREGRELLE